MGFAPTPALCAAAILIRGDDTSQMPEYLSKPTAVVAAPQAAPPHPAWTDQLGRACTETVASRVTRGDTSDWLRGLLYRVTWHTIDRDLNHYPPRYSDHAKDLLYGLSGSSYPRRSPDVGPLMSLRFEVMPNPVAGSTVYAMVHGEGIGDIDADVELSTNWGSVASANAQTSESSFLWMMISTPGFTYNNIVSLGVAPEEGMEVIVTAKLSREMNGYNQSPVVVTRTMAVPVRVFPRSKDSLRAVELPQDVIRRALHPSVARAAYSQAAELRLDAPHSVWAADGFNECNDITVGGRLQVLGEGDVVLYTG
jgi:hypothetical protein